MDKATQIEQITKGAGFIAALDQSGGSTPKALSAYGIGGDAYADEGEMFDLIHKMRSRIANAPAFCAPKVLGAILFEQTMDRMIDDLPSAQYMLQKRHVVPFLKVDKGLQDINDDVQVMKPIDDLDDTLDRANAAGIFGTKMRSVIHANSRNGIRAVVAQQFEIGTQILGHSLIPIIEPEININAPDKAEAETALLSNLLDALDNLGDRQIMLKLTLPEQENLYLPLVEHPKVMRVVALSGGYSRAQANARLSKNTGVIASFSRALSEGLSADQSDAHFNTCIAQTIDEIAMASA